MAIRIAFVMDPPESLTVYKDSTLAMIWAAQRRGWESVYVAPQNLFWRNGQVFADVQRIELKSNYPNADASTEAWFVLSELTRLSADDFQIVMMRKEPPFDMDFINVTYMLDVVELHGVLVANRPSSLRDCNEKFFTTAFPQLLPPQIISQNADELLNFHEEYQDVVYKPLDGMGGKGIFRVKANDPNRNVIIEMLTRNNTTQIVGQKYLPEIVNGDKRILIIDGEAVPYALARVPKPGEARGNLAVGGKGIAQPLTDRDTEIANAMSDELQRRGLVFTGIDVIGDCLTEVNVTCPTCIRELDEAFGLDIAGDLLDVLERKLP